MTDTSQPTNCYQWIATAYDSDRGFALGDSPEQAKRNYREDHGEPSFDLGFSVIRNRSDYKNELARVGKELGFFVEKSIPLLLASEWVIVARITPEGVAALEGHSRASHLLHDWSRDDGEYFITARPARPVRPRLTREQKRAQDADIQPIDGINPSERQRGWAQQAPWGWLDEMAWAHNKGEIELTRAEITYAQARYGQAAATVVVNPVYRLARDAKTEHTPGAGPELVQRALAAGYSQSELARRCGVSREYVRLLGAGKRKMSFAMQVLLEDLASTKPDS
ncbi:MAG: hypothetical protein ACQEXI_16385 [Pseudomonadota bacterium]